MIEGLSHITIIVRDLDRTEKLLTSVLGAVKTYDSGDSTFSKSKERFFDVAGIWIAVMEGDPLPVSTYNHVAFKIADADFDDYMERIQSMGLHICEDRPRVSGEGRSIYFLDYDNHMFELHSGTLDERLQRYAAG